MRSSDHDGHTVDLGLPYHLCPACQAGNPVVPPNQPFLCPDCGRGWIATVTISYAHGPTEIEGDGSGHTLYPFDPTVERMDEL